MYSECKALIFPQHEDYGITPLEANASGRPVIAFGKGGVLETMIPFSGKNSHRSTAIFFPEQSEESLETAINIFNSIEFDSSFIRRHVEKFDKGIFINNIKDFVNQNMPKTFKNIII